MPKYQRLVDYINNYFPDPTKYTESDIRKWAKKSVPAWKNFSKDTKDGILKDWNAFVKPVKIPKLDRPRDERGRFTKVFRKAPTPTPISIPKGAKFDRPRDERGRFVKWTKEIREKIRKLLGGS